MLLFIESFKYMTRFFFCMKIKNLIPIEIIILTIIGTII